MATATSPKQVVPMLADPLPLQPGWLAAEAGRVGQEAGTVRFGRLAAKVILVSSGERRAGYTVADLVGGPSHLPATVASGQTAVVTALGSKLPAILGATQTREPAEYPDSSRGSKSGRMSVEQLPSRSAPYRTRQTGHHS